MQTAFVALVITLAVASVAAGAPQYAKALDAARDAARKSQAASANQRETGPPPAPPAKPAQPPSKPAAPASKPAAPAPAPGAAAPAQGAAPVPPQAAGEAAPAAKPAAPPEPQQGFTYNPEGRRDPFVSLLRRGAGAQGAGGAAARPPGLAGLGVGDVTLKGTVQSRDGFVAILQGSDQKTYIVRPGDKLLDGTIRTITQNDMVIMQQVNDPLSLEKQREVRKVLRQIEAN